MSADDTAEDAARARLERFYGEMTGTYGTSAAGGDVIAAPTAED